MQNDPSEETPSKSFLGLQRDDQFFLGLLFIAILILSVVYLARLSRWGTEPIEIKRQKQLPYQYQIDINQASWVEFAQLNQIGPTLGKKIVAHRDTHGPFRSIDDLLKVKGIGPQKLEENRIHLRLSTPAPE
ncbi:ComEA family DNA-binding protein [Gimesia fumaroli]|uniref:ComE operon protein 1 n=1 Tax=Gimesia fumaroli TaxID=2527976 RepID=A0A518IEM7_9PLAN|nr:helix-hairpin-helix domain-containing protein [Gimesia fumaroli]QDV51535.1 ComE operon protein 1 [Gimesia fumaroli]